jgi:ATP-dependent RNA helicase DDX19/DBP5
MGFNAPSKIQETALPTLLADPPQNMIAQSQSGTGKTAAFVLAMLSRVDPNKNHPQVLCLSPTYELAIQTGEVAAKMAKFCPEIKLRYAVRGEDIARGTKITDHVIIGTPGKILDWGLKFKAFDLGKITVFVLDEADVMIAQQGHQDQCIRIHRQINRRCQMMFFSATYEKNVMEFAEYIVPDPIVIRLLREQESLDNIKQYYVKCVNQEQKYQAISNIYGVITVGQAIIFCHVSFYGKFL